ncbi:alpha/beta hydrolase [Lactiplantibacillus sp. WILCCON 0030]|uniref:Alpha/beta hydrolase n=1 Tax=Lactiplantibacillus brownii TaxID=3069269 RepID=A0ABU1AB39_9LACO|nr:alpha/beta hydrolase [Lactiplantibacillus brownii]MDQ7938177.1 alpha/beta hydrolase [Lactiplantibacillus brownii]
MNEATVERQNHDQHQNTITNDQWAAERTRTESFKLSTGDTAKIFSHEPNYVQSKGIIIDFHGSGFVHLHNDHDTYFCKRIGIATQYTVLDFDYPLAPEHPFPAALNACDELVQHVQAHYADYCAAKPQRLILIGHSAGGNLVVGTQLRALKRAQPVATLAILDYPALDLDTDPDDKSYPAGAVISAAQAKRFNRFYRQNEPLGNPEVSPVLASVSALVGFPKTVIHTADHDTLAAEAELFGQHLLLAHTSVTMHRYLNSLHGFTVSLTGAYQASFDDLVQQIQQLI